MHRSAYAHMALCIERYLEKGRRYRVLDLGARISPNQKLTHKQLLADYDVVYTGVDVQKGRNVDVVMKRPYRIPVKSRTVDLVFSGQTFEHIPFPWASILEVARVLVPGGLAFITVPSRGHVHGEYDCWRYYPDGLRALAAWSGLETVEAHTDFPPVVEGVERPRRQSWAPTVPRGRHDYAQLATREGYYWGDSVGVFRKPNRRAPLPMAIVRSAVLLWANRVGGLPDASTISTTPGRDDVLGTAAEVP
jgi:SAM-dependent methyltransferase